MPGFHRGGPKRAPALPPAPRPARKRRVTNPIPKHLTHYEGGNALSDFRAQALLPRLRALGGTLERLTGIAARHVHWVWSDTPLAHAETDKLDALLRYGDAYTGATEGPLIVVAPRLGTVSPWASKATDIAHNCGLSVHRVERVTEYRLTLKTGLLGGTKAPSADELRAAAALLHDRMHTRHFLPGNELHILA